MTRHGIALVLFLTAGVWMSFQSFGQEAAPQQLMQDAPPLKQLEHQSQQVEYEEMVRKYEEKADEDFRQREEAWARAVRQQKKEDELQARFEKILVKWEEQSERYDRILRAMEVKFDVK